MSNVGFEELDTGNDWDGVVVLEDVSRSISVLMAGPGRGDQILGTCVDCRYMAYDVCITVFASSGLCAYIVDLASIARTVL